MVLVMRGLDSSVACGVLPDQGLDPCPREAPAPAVEVPSLVTPASLPCLVLTRALSLYTVPWRSAPCGRLAGHDAHVRSSACIFAVISLPNFSQCPPLIVRG